MAPLSCPNKRAPHGPARRSGREESDGAALVSEQTRAAWPRAQKRTRGDWRRPSRVGADGALSHESDEQSSYFGDTLLVEGVEQLSQQRL